MTTMSDLLAFQQKKASGDPPLRQGKWTREEEEYVHCLIDEFKTGMMPLAEGTSLRTFLSKMLNCHPMRISKKFVGSNYNGKQVYARRTGDDRLSNEEVKARRDKLCDLERKFLAKIAHNKGKPKQAPMQQQQQQMGSRPQQTQSPVPPSDLSGLSRVTTSGVDLRNLLNQAALKRGEVGGAANTNTSDLSRNISLMDMPPNDNNGATNSNSSHSLQNLFQELVGGGNISTGSLSGLNMLLQQNAANNNGGGSNHFNSSKANSRAAAAGRALLQSGFGLEKKPASSSSSNKPLSSFTSAELAAELRNRSSLQDLVAQLGNGGSSNSSSNINAASRQNNSSFGRSLASLQDTSNNNSALGSLIRNSSIDVSNLVERQGSIDSLSNLAIRSRLQSIQSMGSLFDPLLEGSSGDNNNNNNNSQWTAKNAAASLAAKVSSENLSGSQTGRELMESLGVGRASLNSFSASASSGNSGLNLASLLNNDDALKRLEASAPSSLNSNFNFSQQQETQRGSSSEAQTALERFLSQKNGRDNSGNNNSHSDQQQLMMNVAAGSGGSGSGMDPIMSSLLSSLRNGNNDAGSDNSESDFDALKRKFLEQAGDGLMEHRRNKPFR